MCGDDGTDDATPGPWYAMRGIIDSKYPGLKLVVKEDSANHSVLYAVREKDAILAAAAPTMREAIESALALITLACDHGNVETVESCPNCKAQWTLAQALDYAEGRTELPPGWSGSKRGDA